MRFGLVWGCVLGGLATASPWTKGGHIVTDASGHVVRCDQCPCVATNTITCAGITYSYPATLFGRFCGAICPPVGPCVRPALTWDPAYGTWVTHDVIPFASSITHSCFVGTPDHIQFRLGCAGPDSCSSFCFCPLALEIWIQVGGVGPWVFKARRCTGTGSGNTPPNLCNLHPLLLQQPGGGADLYCNIDFTVSQ